MHIRWMIIIGFIAGVIAKLIHLGPNEPAGFILTTLLGIAGAFVATYLARAIGWYQADQGAYWGRGRRHYCLGNLGCFHRAKIRIDLSGFNRISHLATPSVSPVNL
jgi:uncharacterized membrane protein YeaQ/YmgE (transglycosylase-associated protein family)